MSPNGRKMVLIASRDGARCVWCAKAIGYRSADATVDHVRCRSRGGPNAVENLVLACAGCNGRRGDTPAEEWLERCLAAGLAADVEAIEAAIRRSDRLHRRRLRKTAARPSATRRRLTAVATRAS